MAANEGNNAVSPPRDNLLEYSLSKRLILLSHFSFSGNAFHLDFFDNYLATNSWVFVYELSGCMFKSRCCPINFRCGACFEQGVFDIRANYRVWIHSETLAWHDKNIQWVSNFSLLFSSKLLISALNIYIYISFFTFKRIVLSPFCQSPEVKIPSEFMNSQGPTGNRPSLICLYCVNLCSVRSLWNILVRINS